MVLDLRTLSANLTSPNHNKIHSHDNLPTSCHEYEEQVVSLDDEQIFENILKQQVETGHKTILPNLLGIQKMNIYPNPSDGQFVLKFSASSKKNTAIRILNLTGQSIYEENLADFEGSYQQEIDISKKMVSKNFDDPKEFLEVLEKLEINNESSNSLIATLCSRKVLKV